MNKRIKHIDMMIGLSMQQVAIAFVRKLVLRSYV